MIKLSETQFRDYLFLTIPFLTIQVTKTIVKRLRPAGALLCGKTNLGAYNQA